jgi:hypothetical protein
MRKLLYSSLILLVLVSACKSKKNNTTSDADQANTSDTTTFYDIKGFFESEINDVKTTPYFIYTKITKDDKKQDSMPVKPKDFIELAKPFIETDITQKEIKHFYKEDIFRDLSTKSITFSYSTKNKELDIQNVDVLVNEETNKVNFVIMRTNKTVGDSTIISQMNWNKGKSFFINKTILKKEGNKSSTQQLVSWNN